LSHNSNWYADGLRFGCTQCGKCCGGAPGTVLVSDPEIEALAQELGIGVARFREDYTRRLPSGRVSLRERPSYDCVFFVRGEGCAVYGVRPKQCRTWPFWRSNLASRKHWDAASEDCPGMDQGPLQGSAEIKRREQDDGTSGFIPRLG